MKKLLVVDNYDSFTYNIVQYLEELGAKTVVYRNDVITLSTIKKLNPFGIVISPGPCTPKEAGKSNEIIKNFSGKIPILGVCLGHQCIGHVFGAKIVKAKTIMHGKISPIKHHKKQIFKGIPSPFKATRYHSLVIKPDTLPKDLTVVARADTKDIMGIEHKSHPTFGIQFHPESIMTDHGHKLLRNFITLAKGFKKGKKT